jgi:hypothetical protein
VQAAGANNASAASIAATFGSNVTAGNLIVAFFLGHSSAGAPTCAGSLNGAYTADTDYSNMNGSGKHYRWFWFLSSAGGAETVTVTCSSGAQSQYVQVAEYSWGGTANAADAPVNVNTTSGASTVSTATVTSGTPTQAGDLVLMSVCTTTESNKQFTANSPLTAVVLDGSGNTGGQANASSLASMAFGELLGAGTGTVAGSISLGANSDFTGQTILGFSPPVTAVPSVAFPYSFPQMRTEQIPGGGTGRIIRS